MDEGTPLPSPPRKVSVDCGQEFVASLGPAENTPNDKNNANVVILPTRYKMLWISKVAIDTQLGNKQSCADVGCLQNPNCVMDNGVHDSNCRENDLNTAIKWLRQEINVLKEQDRMLMRKFLDLRATIHQLQQRHLVARHAGPKPDHVDRRLEDSKGSLVSLGERKLSDPRVPVLETLSGSSLLRNTEIEVEFRRRTVSLLTPRKHGAWTRKDRSKEIL